MDKKLSKLNKVQLRDVWGHEAIDFTNWLALDENLDILSEEIGIEVKLIKTEANVGKFSVDILAEEEASGRKIIIENQLEDTDHDHLGKIITYASGYDAEIIIWIVKGVRDEHQNAIDWLNEHTDEKVNFFLIRIELWQIDGSNPAPKFDVIVSPNEWAKVIKTNPNNSELTETKLQQLNFWSKLKEFINGKDKHIRLQTPRPQHWYDISVGCSEAHITLTINTQNDNLGCEIYINKNKDLFNYFKSRKEEFENDVGQSVEWGDANVTSRIKIKKNVSDVFNLEEAESNFVWFYENTLLLKKVFDKYFKDYKKK